MLNINLKANHKIKTEYALRSLNLQNIWYLIVPGTALIRQKT